MAQTHPRTPDRLRHRARGRIVGLDVARALALFGMMATHLLPDSVDGQTVSWWQQLAGGRAAALFALLAGVSLALMTDRAVTGRDSATRGDHRAAEPEPTAYDVPRRTALKAARAGVVVRACLIGALGLLLGGLDTGIAVILTYYAVLFVLGLPFLGMGPRLLAVLVAGWALLAPVLSHLVRPYLPERVAASPSLDFLLLQPVRLVSELTFTGYYPSVPWLAYLLAGLAIGRLSLQRTAPAAGLAVAGALLALSAWGSSWLVLHRLGGLARLRTTAPADVAPFDVMAVDQALVRGTFGTTPTTSWWWLTTAAPHSSTPFDLLQTIGSAMLVIGVCLLAGQAAPRALGLLFAAGTMTLTLYSLHLVALDLGVGLPDSAEVFWAHVAGATAFGALWRATLGRGPLEALTHTCSGLARSTVLALSRTPGRTG